MNVNDIAFMYNSALTDSSLGATSAVTRTGKITEELQNLWDEAEKNGKKA